MFLLQMMTVKNSTKAPRGHFPFALSNSAGNVGTFTTAPISPSSETSASLD
jgi:hypothetical protein